MSPTNRRRRKQPLGRRIRKALRKKLRALRNRLLRYIKANKFKSFLIGLTAVLILVMLLVPRGGSSLESYEGYTHNARFEEDVIVNGIDVSYAQGNGIDWNDVKKSGVDFAFIRAGYRAAQTGKIHKDDLLEQHAKGAQDAGLMTGYYFFSQALTMEEAKEEARKLLEYTEGYDPSLPYVIDLETFGNGRQTQAILNRALGAMDLYLIADAFCSVIEEAGYDTMVYGNYDFLTHYADGEFLGNRTHIWLAHYHHKTSYPHGYSYWQASESGSIVGIDGAVDLDFWYLDPSKPIYSTDQSSQNRTSLTECNVSLRDHSPKLRFGIAEPGVVVKDGFRTLEEGKDYVCGYVHNTANGTGYAVVTGIGDYKDTVTTSFLIR